MKRFLRAAFAAALGLATPFAQAVAVEPRDGWVVFATEFDYPTLLARAKEAVAANGMAVVTEAGPTEAAASRGEIIPGNRVLGVFRNDFAVRMIRADVAAMIEAPIRLYVTESENGAMLSYKKPSFVFAPYMDAAGEEGAAVAAELDMIFATIAADAVAE